MSLRTLPISFALVLVAACAQHAPWSYEGATGPEHWADLSQDYAVARTGRHQSPIDLSSQTGGADVGPIAFHYKPVPLRIVNTGHSIQIDCENGSYARIDGLRYDLVRVDFHSPSEHLVDGRSLPMEIQFLHRGAAGDLAVVAALVEVGPVSDALAPIFANLPATEGKKKVKDAEIDVTTLLPKDHTRWVYEGSLTTPPCTEGVRWAVMRKPIPAARGQIDSFRKVCDGNFRPVQPLNDRTVRLGGG